MSKTIGRLVNIGIAAESTRGTAESSADYYLPQAEGNFNTRTNMATNESAYGVLADADDMDVVEKYSQVEFNGKVGINSIGALLKSLLGSVSTAADTPESGVNTHSFSLANNIQHPSLTIFGKDANEDIKMARGMIENMDFNLELDQYVMVQMGIRANGHESASTSPSYTAETHFLPQHANLYFATSTAGLGGATATPVRSFSMSINKNIEDDRTLGSLGASDRLNKQFTVEGNFEITYDATTFRDDYVAGTAKAMRLKMANTGVTIGASSNPTITLDFNKVKFTEVTKNTGNNDVVTLSISFKAMYSTTDAEMIAVDVVNTVASY